MTQANPEEIQFLESVPLFTELSKAQLEQVLAAGHRRNFSAQAFVYLQGDPAEGFYLLLEGRIKLSQVTPEGQQVILRYAAPAEAFGVIAVLSRARYPVSAETVEDSQLLVWDQQSMRLLMERLPQVGLNALAILAARVREFQDRVRELSTERVERRIARALIRLARQTGRKTEAGILIDLPLTRQDLAEMTGTSLYTVSRTLSNWESQGLVQSKREQVTITYPHGLVSIAEDLPMGGAVNGWLPTAPD
jgi:CRP-like cAMP-binding protein